MIRFFLFVLNLFLFLFCFSQNAKKNETVFVLPHVDSLNYYSSVMFNADNDIMRYEANESFKRLLLENLQNKNAYKWNFDTVKILSVQSANDLSFRLFTWCMPLNSGQFEHFGWVLVHSKKTDAYNVVMLNDVSTQLQNPEKEFLKKNNWYGAVYYQMIEHKYQGEKIYTLIGWNGWNSLTQQKIIDAIYFTPRGDVVFGKNIFRGKGYSNRKRLIFEYGDRIVMKLRYENHDYKIITKKDYSRSNSKINKNNDEALKTEKKKINEKIKTEPMIVFDELVPMKKELEGQYQFYYPLSTKTNAFFFDGGKWSYRELDTKDDVDRNIKPLRFGLKQ